MNARLSEGNVLRTAKRILGLAGLAALALVCAGPARAQSNPAQTESAAARSAAAVSETSPGVGRSGSATAAQQVVAQNSPAKPPAPKGQSEGIKVHGHWTIEVRNPDGSVVRHVEFENSLVTTGDNTGASLLAGVLGRVVTPGSWIVVLGANPADAIYIFEPGSPASSASCQLVQSNNPNNNIVCSNNLSVNGPQLGSGGISSGSLTGATLTFSGSGVVPLQNFPPAITSVQTGSLVCAASTSPTSCSTTSSGTLAVFFTSRLLDGLNGDPNSVPVSAGQTVTVTVTISFQ